MIMLLYIMNQYTTHVRANCVGWFNKITLNKFTRNKQTLIDEDTCRNRGDKISGGDKGFGKRCNTRFNIEKKQ